MKSKVKWDATTDYDTNSFLKASPVKLKRICQKILKKKDESSSASLRTTPRKSL